MKYIEELLSGNTFLFNNELFILTVDFKTNGNRLCYSMNNGNPKWFSGSDIVEEAPIFKLDENNNVVPIKVTNNPPSHIS